MGVLKTDPDRRSAAGETVAAPAASLATVQQQCDEMLIGMKAMGDQLAELAARESELRALIEHDALLEPYMSQLVKTIRKSEVTSAAVGAAIEQAPLRLEPFPYMVVDDLLPTRLYKCLVRGIPAPELFDRKSAGKEHLAVPFALAPAYSRRAWRYMAETIVPEMIAPRVIEKVRPQIDAWISQNWPGLAPADVELRGSGGRIMLRRRGYAIAPHRDPKWGFITCIMYLARPQDSESWGTQIYSVDEDTEAASAAPYWIDPKRCHLVEDVRFRPNRMLVFLNSGGAHGAHIPADAQPEDLERYIYQFRVGPPADSIAMLKAKLPAERQSLWVGKAIIDY